MKVVCVTRVSVSAGLHRATTEPNKPMGVYIITCKSTGAGVITPGFNVVEA